MYRLVPSPMEVVGVRAISTYLDFRKVLKVLCLSGRTLFGVWGPYPRTQNVRVSLCVPRTGGKSPEIFTLLLSTSLFYVCTECVILLARTCTDMDHLHTMKTKKNEDAKIRLPLRPFLLRSLYPSPPSRHGVSAPTHIRSSPVPKSVILFRLKPCRLLI